MSELKSKKVIRLYYGFQLFFSLLVWLPIFYEYQKHFGLNDAEIFSIQSLYYIAFCLLEIPTGLVADFWGYRRCLRIGSGLLALTQLFPIFMPSYLGFLLHFMGIALSRSLISGASTAYLYEHLKVNQETAHFKVLEGRSRAYSLLAKVLAWSAVGSLMAYHVTLPYWLTLAATSVALGLAVAMPESPGQGQSHAASGAPKALSWSALRLILARLLVTAKQLKQTPYLVFLMVQGVAIFVLGRIIQVNLFQPILSQEGVELPAHGMVMAAMTVFEAAGSGYPQVVRRWFNDRNAVFALTTALGASLLVMPGAGAFGVMLLLCLFGLFSGWAYPIQKQLFNDAIPDSSSNFSLRATMMSIESIVDRAGSAVAAALLGGIMASPQGLNQFLWVSGGITLLAVLVLMILFKRLSQQ